MERFADDVQPNESDERSQLFDRAADYVLAVSVELNRRLT